MHRVYFQPAPSILPVIVRHFLHLPLHILGELFLDNGAFDPFHGAAAERVTQLKSSSRLSLGILGYIAISMLFSTGRGPRFIV
jgi:hypothetical protein